MYVLRRAVATMTVLLLGGTAEARRLAELLVADGVDLVTSLAGDIADLRLPPGGVRVGGFGGVGGLVRYLGEHDVTAVVDATHPFAAQMTRHAATACAAASVPLLRLSRPSWATRTDAPSWHWVDSIAEARETAGRLGGRVFLAIGRQSLPEFADWVDRSVLARVVDSPAMDVPGNWEVFRGRGPFRLEDELELLRRHGIEVLVTKDSGGPTDAKLDAAAQLGIPVVILHRPALPASMPLVASPVEAAAWTRAVVTA